MSQKIPAPASVIEAVNTLVVSRQTLPLYGKRESNESLYAQIRKIEEPGSGQQTPVGRILQPFDMQMVHNFQASNIHHATCLYTKTACTLGLGFKDGKKKKPEMEAQEFAGAVGSEDLYEETELDRALDPLCDTTFADVETALGEDYFQCANAYLEVVRESAEENAPIVGLHHIPSPDVHIFMEDDKRNWHYEIFNSLSGRARHFAKYGDLPDFTTRGGQTGNVANFSVEPGVFSEVVHFRRPTSLHRYYGIPDWVSAVPSIELDQMIIQQNFDLFLNRGVPEFMLFITGAKLSRDDWEKVENALKANIGLGNAHKSLALNLQNPDIKIQLEKLNIEAKTGDTFQTLTDALSLRIVSAHRVPPLLAGIQIPGKLGAVNELPNALVAFQILVIGPAQRVFRRTFAKTLGDRTKNGGLPLREKHFNFRTILDVVNLGNLDTVGRMRETLPEAQGKGRKLEDGVKD